MTLCNIIPENVCTLIELLRFLHLNRLQEVFPKVSIVLRIVLTIPVTCFRRAQLFVAEVNQDIFTSKHETG